jgi:hypothetical protein
MYQPAFEQIFMAWYKLYLAISIGYFDRWPGQETFMILQTLVPHSVVEKMVEIT